jgi:hypothetical protein
MKRIVVLGAGESGSGAAILAKEKGFDVFVSDCGTISEPYRALLDQNGIQWEDGKHSFDRIKDADEYIKSPGIPLNAPILEQIRAYRNSLPCAGEELCSIERPVDGRRTSLGVGLHFYLTVVGATKENHPVAKTAEEWYAYLKNWARKLK